MSNRGAALGVGSISITCPLLEVGLTMLAAETRRSRDEVSPMLFSLERSIFVVRCLIKMSSLDQAPASSWNLEAPPSTIVYR